MVFGRRSMEISRKGTRVVVPILEFLILEGGAGAELEGAGAAGTEDLAGAAGRDAEAGGVV
jgi:hypothetical protein